MKLGGNHVPAQNSRAVLVAAAPVQHAPDEPGTMATDVDGVIRSKITGSSIRIPGEETDVLGTDFAAVLSLVGDGVVCVDENGTIVLFNRAAEEIFGHRSSDVVGLSIGILIPDDLQGAHSVEVAGFTAPGGALRRAMGVGREVWGVRKDGTRLAVEATLSRQQVGGRQIATAVIRDVSVRKAAETQRDLVAREVAHRLRNTMAIVGSIVRLTARNAMSLETFETSLLGRFDAVARTNDSLIKGAHMEADLETLLQNELTPLVGSGASISLEGAAVQIDERHAVALALVFHELTTNAVKYGALSTPAGCLRVCWTVENTKPRRLRLDWTETHGPPVTAPSRKGFGSTLISRSLKPFGGIAILVFNSEGVVCNVVLPLDEDR